MITAQTPRPTAVAMAFSFVLTAAILALLSACVTTSEPEETSTAIFYPPLPELPRLQFLTTINDEGDIGGGGSDFNAFLLGTPEATEGISKPFDVAHEKGKIYVVDTRINAVVILDLVEKKFDFIKDTKGGPLQAPLSIFIDEDGYKYVADKSRRQVVVYNQRDEFHRVYGAENQFQPVDVVVHGNRLYVADVSDHEIEVLDKDTGEVIDKIGEQGSEEGQFHWPTHLALDASGNLYVTDFLNFRVQKFDAKGNFVKVIGELGDFPGAMPRPKGVALDREGHLYAVDVAFELVQIFDEETATVLMGFGKNSPMAGGNWLPAGIDIDYDNIEFFSQYVDADFRPKYLVYVANQAGSRKLNVYAFGDWTGTIPEGARTAADKGS